MKQESVIAGYTYRHTNGALYEVDAVAEHSETNELLVIYHARYGQSHDPKRIWARPLAMFCDGRFRQVIAPQGR